MNKRRYQGRVYGPRVFHRSTASPHPPPPSSYRPAPTPPSAKLPPSATPPPPTPPAGAPPPTIPFSPPIYYEYPTTLIENQDICNSDKYIDIEYEYTPSDSDNDQKTPEGQNQETPDYLYSCERRQGPNDSVWIYPYNQEEILLPVNYYDEITVNDVPPNGFTPQIMLYENGQLITFMYPDASPNPMLYMPVIPDFEYDRYGFFFPEDGDACLRIVEALLPLQIATGRVPGFFEYVKHPVILGNIKHKIIDGKYTRVRDVIHDLRAIVWNMNYYLCQRWEDWVKEENNMFSATLEGQLGRYYPENRFSEITGNHERKPS